MSRALADLKFEPNWLSDEESRGIPLSLRSDGEREVPPDDSAIEAMRVGERVRFFGQSFVWTDGHLTSRDLAPLRCEGDADADAVAELMIASGYKGDIFDCQDGASRPEAWHPAALAFVDKCSQELPSWLDYSLVAEGDYSRTESGHWERQRHGGL